MKWKNNQLVFLILTMVLTIVGCYKWQIAPVLAENQTADLSDTIHAVVNPASTLRESSPLTDPYVPVDDHSPLLRDVTWPDEGVTDPSKITNDYGTEPDPDSKIDPNTGKPTGIIAHVKTAHQYLKALYGYYELDRNGQVTGIPYQKVDSTSNGYSDVTKIVLEADIDIPNYWNEKNANIKVRTDPKDPNSQLVDVNITTGHLLSYVTTGNDPWLTGDAGYANKEFRIIRPPRLSEETDSNGTHTFSHIVIDGGKDKHTLNAGNFCIWANPQNNTQQQDITFQNIVTYGCTYWGLINAHNGTNYTRQTYKNMDYYGAQFSYGEGTDTIVFIGDKNGEENTVNAYSLKDYNYTSPITGQTYTYLCQPYRQRGDQQNIQAKSVRFFSNSRYNGYTYSGNVLVLTGNAILEKNAIVNLFPHREDSTRPEDIGAPSLNDSSAGIYLSGANSKITMGEKSNLNVVCDRKQIMAQRTIENSNTKFSYTTPKVPSSLTDNSKGTYSTASIGLYMGGTASTSGFTYTDKSEASIYVHGIGKPYSSSSNLVTVNGGTADIGNGAMYVKADELGTSNINVVTIGSNASVQIGKNGTFDLSAPDAEGNVNMLSNSGGPFNVYVYKPKLLQIKTPTSNPNSYLVNGSGRVEMHGVQAEATGHTWDSNGAGNPTVTLKETPFEYLNLPFYGHNLQTAIPPYLAALTNPDQQMGVQSNQASLSALKVVINDMIGDSVGTGRLEKVKKIREFDTIKVTSIGDAPTSKDTTPKLHGTSAITPNQRSIQGIIDTGDNTATSQAPRVRLQLQHKEDVNNRIDLGTQRDDAKDIVDPLTTALDPHPDAHPVEPDAPDWLESKHFPELSDKGKFAQITVGNDKVDAPWYYIDNSMIQWNGDQFTIDIDKVLEKYNNTEKVDPTVPVPSGQQPQKKKPDPINYLTGTDKIVVTVEHNFQLSDSVLINVVTLNLQVDPTKQNITNEYCLGSDLLIPLRYQERAAKADPKLTVKGWYVEDPNSTADLDLTQTMASTGQYTIQQTATDWTKLNDWQIPAEQATKLGTHMIKLYGVDDQGGKSPLLNDNSNIVSAATVADSDYTYKYTVLNLPAYGSDRTFNRPKIGDRNNRDKDVPITMESDNSIKEQLPMGRYVEHNIFTPKVDTASIDNFSFKRVTTDDININRQDSTLVIEYADPKNTNVKKTVTINKFEYNKQYTASQLLTDSKYKNIKNIKDIVITDSNGTHFLKGLTFKLYTNVSLSKVPNATLAKIDLVTNFVQNGNARDITLASMNPITMGNVYEMELTVPDTIDYGKNVPKSNSDYSISNIDEVKSNLKLQYLPVNGKQIRIYVNYQDNTADIWKYNTLKYKKTGSGSVDIKDTDTEIYEGQKINAGINTPVATIPLANDWWDQGTQKQGLFLYTQSTANLKSLYGSKYQGTIEWTVTDAP